MQNLRWVVLGSLVLVAGCARVATTTTLNADGSFTRQVAYTVNKNTMAGDPAQDPGAPKQKTKPVDYFKIPSADPTARVVNTEDKKAYVATVTRQISSGSAPLKDIALLADDGTVMATSTVSVQKLADGALEYLETLHSTKPLKPGDQMAVPDLRDRVKRALPEKYQNTATIDRLTHEVMLNLTHALMGPPEPTMFDLFASPEAALRRIEGAVLASNIRSFRTALPDLSQEDAKAIAIKLVDILNQDSLSAPSPEGSPSESKQSDANEMTPMFFTVRFPGSIVRTNGILDPISGEVYWSLLPGGLPVGDVTLDLVVKP